jgi:hypothetical protein
MREAVAFSSPALLAAYVFGTGPITISLYSTDAAGLTIASDGTLSWANPEARLAPYSVTVRASNRLATVTKTFAVQVEPSYNVSVAIIQVGNAVITPDPSVIKTVANEVTIVLKGSVTGLFADSVLRTVRVRVWLRRAGEGFSPIILNAVTVSTTGLYQISFTVPQFTGGLFYVGANHPAVTTYPIDKAQDRFRTYAMRVVSNVYLRGTPGSFSGSGVIENTGDEPLTNVNISLIQSSASLPENFEAEQDQPKVLLSIPGSIPPLSTVTYTVSAKVLGPFFSYW